MITYLVIGTTLGGLIVYFFTHLKSSKNEPFTLKSDGKTHTKNKDISKNQNPGGQSNSAFLDLVGSIKNEIDSPNQKSESQLPEQIDMSKITGIRLEGGDDIQIFNNDITVNADAIIEIKKSTLYIKSKPTNISIVNGVVTGNMTGGNLVYLDGKLISVGNVTSIGSTNETKSIPLVNFNTERLDRLSISGSGDVDMHNIGCNVNMDFVISGSGDIKTYNCKFVSLAIKISGSGDVWLNKDCQAKFLHCIISGSGKITSKIRKIKNVTKKISGSGSIICASDKKDEKWPPDEIEELAYFTTPPSKSKYYNGE